MGGQVDAELEAIRPEGEDVEDDRMALIVEGSTLADEHWRTVANVQRSRDLGGGGLGAYRLGRLANHDPQPSREQLKERVLVLFEVAAGELRAQVRGKIHADVCEGLV